MATSSLVTIQSLFQYPYIVERISQIAPTSMAMSNFFGMGVRVSGSGDERTMTSGTRRSDQRKLVFDIFNNTRTTAGVKAYGTGPTIRRPKPSGQTTANALRTYEARVVDLNEVVTLRNMGSSNFDSLDSMGRQYVTRQFDSLVRSGLNSREFAFVSMLKGGFKVKELSEGNWACVPNTSDYTTNILHTADYQIPASHKAQLDIGGAGDIIDASWATPTTKIVDHIRTVRAQAVSRSGLAITEIWCNTNVLNKILSNNQAQEIGGSSFRVFDRLTGNQVQSGDTTTMGNLDSGKYVIEVELRALPEVTFHVYDDGITLPVDASTREAEDAIEDISGQQAFVKFLGDNEILMTPGASDASEWLDMYDVLEVIQKNYETQPEMLYGFGAWLRRQMAPVPSYELHMMDNYCPAIKVPTAVYNPTVIF